MSAGERGIHFLVWICVFTVVCIIFLALRLWAAIVSKRRMYPDDAMVVFAFANIIILEGVTIWAIFHGMGKHASQLDTFDTGVQFKLIVAGSVTWLLGTVFIKFSVLWLYTRLFSIRSFKRWAYGLMGIVVCYGIAFMILFMTRCEPVWQQWDPQPGGSCRNITNDEIISVVINMSIDIAIIILPLPVLWGLQLALRYKVVITIMFSIGLMTISIMAWRLQFTIVSSSDPDFVFNFITITLISFLELWLGVIVACIPTLAPLIKIYVKPKISARSDRTNIRLQKVPNTIVPSQGSRATPKASNPSSEFKEDSPVGSLERPKPTELGNATTNCRFEQGTRLPSDAEGGINVEHDIEAQRA
ncbi:hypothetical protein TOPH_09134 [Tolypocladium ophioglossoides CBS 100239]|uniref:Rhodopsin domain-containing protein n=1 Tax=Tolypocladium ophioglossoides (strain CBS 100239) TaxID=1163406 RepID=A0A0L0MWD7_TOLOC|nr:hypothetical protein TOPH_09134 [Tolypocladium ophioglossoides CBS 100239]